MTRLFVGTFLDRAEAVRVEAQTREVAGRIAGDHLKLRISKGEKLHLTWAFLGEVDPTLTQAGSPLTSTIQQIASQMEPSQLSFDSLEIWQGVLVLRSKTCGLRFQGQVESARERLKEFSRTLAEDRKKFTPHLTVCRFSGQLNQHRALELFHDIYPVEMPVEHVSLIESKQGLYIEIKRWPLHISG